MKYLVLSMLFSLNFVILLLLIVVGMVTRDWPWWVLVTPFGCVAMGMWLNKVSQ